MFGETVGNMLKQCKCTQIDIIVEIDNIGYLRD